MCAPVNHFVLMLTPDHQNHKNQKQGVISIKKKAHIVSYHPSFFSAVAIK